MAQCKTQGLLPCAEIRWWYSVAWQVRPSAWCTPAAQIPHRGVFNELDKLYCARMRQEVLSRRIESMLRDYT